MRRDFADLPIGRFADWIQLDVNPIGLPARGRLGSPLALRCGEPVMGEPRPGCRISFPCGCHIVHMSASCRLFLSEQLSSC